MVEGGRWRSLDEAMPLENEKVLLLYCASKQVYIGSWRFAAGWQTQIERIWHMEGYVLDVWNQPDYWRSLPSLPE